ncbi:unnamed protein product, partial [Mesorhabditis spiculigera]
MFTIENTAQLWLLIFYDPELRWGFSAMINPKIAPAQEDSLRSAIGHRLKFANAEEGDIYFKQLQTMWEPTPE